MTLTLDWMNRKFDSIPETYRNMALLEEGFQTSNNGIENDLFITYQFLLTMEFILGDPKRRNLRGIFIGDLRIFQWVIHIFYLLTLSLLTPFYTDRNVFGH